ncbi:PcfJ domain-containing protein [Flavobacterium stagni]|uniref:PcfJ-like protein n=1 Tax=Flavobacterium stagni TaxID=2506421 RepID=A0A4Q1KEW2_9FLAO|nr:PcfJ domain-containing protein [Flavobacterium stagni]RXR24268.1 hypothetical protein EQG61_02165 [Flavobacterium stagni]
METLLATNKFSLITSKTSNFAWKVRYCAALSRNTEKIGTLGWTIADSFLRMPTEQHEWRKEVFKSLLLTLEEKKYFALLRNDEAIQVVAKIAFFGNKTIRSIDSLTRTQWEAEAQLSTLIQHCFAQYPVAKFLESAFYGDNKVHMLWYIQLGRGKSVLQLNGFPVQFTAKMAHLFTHASDELEINQAIRWAQAKGYGASDLMAEIVAWSSLATHFDREEFWKTVIQWLAKTANASLDQVDLVLQYIDFKRNAQATFDMNGRTWNALYRQAEAWHIEMCKAQEAKGRAEWKTSGIQGFSKTMHLEIPISYVIYELVNSESLYEEGASMYHCVAEYEFDCIEGSSAIFTMRKFKGTEETIEATLEVNLDYKTIVQAKAKYNEDISEESYILVQEWAKKAGLRLDFEWYEYENYPPQQQQPVVYNRVNNTYDTQFIVRIILFALFLLYRACS